VRVTCGPDWRGPGPAFHRAVRLDRVYASGELDAAIMRARSRGGSDHAQAHCVARAVPVRIRQVHAGVMQPVSSSPACATDAAGRYACLKCIPVVSIPTQTGGRPGSIASFAPQGKKRRMGRRIALSEESRPARGLHLQRFTVVQDPGITAEGVSCVNSIAVA